MSRSTPAPPQAPLDWVASTFGLRVGDLNCRDTLGYLAPTADLPRQGREEQVRKVWTCTYDLRGSPRKELLYIYGPSGVGKTTLLRYIAERSDSDLRNLRPDIRDWVKQ